VSVCHFASVYLRNARECSQKFSFCFCAMKPYIVSIGLSVIVGKLLYAVIVPGGVLPLLLTGNAWRDL